jgi:hypothetical protein
VIRECDVLVVGGGCAGISAAIAAAGRGVKVILVEKYGFLGGLATAGMVGTVCGLYHRTDGKYPHYAFGGFVQEFAERLAKNSFSQPVPIPGGLWVLPYDYWVFKRLADEMVMQTHGLELLLHTTLVSLKVYGGHVETVELLVSDRLMTLQPKYIVDCTGEATVVHLAGGATTEASCQSAAILFTMGPVDTSLQQQGRRISVMSAIAKAVEQGLLDAACRTVCFMPASTSGNKVGFKLAFTDKRNKHISKITNMEVTARQLVDQVSRFLTANFCEFRAANILNVADQIGIRLGRLAKGLAVIDETDVIECRKFSDGVACGVWPIEEWDEKGMAKLTYLPPGQYYEIPLRALMAYGLDNVFTAGRCISATEKALYSARVIGTAMATGWAAGHAATVLVKGQPLSVAVKELRDFQVPR